jgi:hypothetical protein
MPWNISENLEPVYTDDPRESLGEYVLVDTQTGTVISDPRQCVLLHYDHFDGDKLERLSDNELSDYAKKHGVALDDDFVN